MKIPYLDLQAQYQSIKSEIDSAIADIFANNAFVLGKAVADFESDFASYCQTDYCVGLNSGTSALTLALRALDIGPGDEVITAANTFIATAAAIAHTGATPKLVDVDPADRNISVDQIEQAIGKKTRAIIPVHLYGRPAKMNEIMAIAERHGLPVIEDAAQAHGADYFGKRAGSIGKIACFSFYPGKNLGAAGEAGAVVTDDNELDRKIRMLRDHGSEKRYHHDLLGYNARMEGIQGAVLGVKLKHLDSWTESRIRIAQMYNDLLATLPLDLPLIEKDVRSVFHLYVIASDQRDELQAYLAEKSVPSLIHYPIPIHLQPAFGYLGCKAGDFPVSEQLGQRILSLPIFPELKDEQVEYVASQIRGFFG